MNELERIAVALENLEIIEMKRLKLIEEDIKKENEFRENYLEIMNETSKKITDFEVDKNLPFN